MPRPRCLIALAVALLAALPAAAAHAYVPAQKALYRDGPDGRFLLAGQWLFRADPQDAGLSQGWMRNFDTTGWSNVSVPNAWNATDASVASFMGGVGWY